MHKGEMSAAGKSWRAVLCGVLVFDGSLCYSISKVAARVKVLPTPPPPPPTPVPGSGGSGFPSLNEV